MKKPKELHGVGKIYGEEEIEKPRASQSLDKEYGLKYIGKMDNVNHH